MDDDNEIQTEQKILFWNSRKGRSLVSGKESDIFYPNKSLYKAS